MSFIRYTNLTGQYKDDKPKKGDFMIILNMIILNIKGIKNKPEECLILVTPTDR